MLEQVWGTAYKDILNNYVLPTLWRQQFTLIIYSYINQNFPF